MEASHEPTPPQIAGAIVRQACEQLRDHFGDDKRVMMYDIRIRNIAVRLPDDRSLAPNRVGVIVRKRLEPIDQPAKHRRRGDPEHHSHVFVAAGLCDLETCDLQVLSNSLEPMREYSEYDAWFNRLVTLIETHLARG